MHNFFSVLSSLVFGLHTADACAQLIKWTKSFSTSLLFEYVFHSICIYDFDAFSIVLKLCIFQDE